MIKNSKVVWKFSEKFATFDFKDCLNYKTLLSSEELEIENVARDFF